MQLFFNNEIKELNQDYTFDKIESRHIIKVLRKKEGDTLHLTNGKNSLFNGIIIDANDKKCRIVITKITKQKRQRDYKIIIAVAPTKNNNRLEWFLEKATELGIDEIYPILCKHSERKHIKRERMEKVVLSAMKQSLQFQLPIIHKLSTFDEVIKHSFSGQKLIAQCLFDKEPSNKNFLQKAITPNTDIIVFIGPEGGFSDKEIEHALQNNFIPVSLGDNRLRTETAAIVAVNSIHLINQIAI
jgi:16S rRNA (uracil1498-N3)-methyltransferase